MVESNIRDLFALELDKDRFGISVFVDTAYIKVFQHQAWITYNWDAVPYKILPRHE